MGPCLFPLEHLFCLSHRQSRRTMSVDNVSLKICLLGPSNFMITLTNFTRPWDDFMVHGVNNPLRWVSDRAQGQQDSRIDVP